MQNQEADTIAMFDLIERMLEYEPDQRIKLSEALDHKFFEQIPASLKLAAHSVTLMSRLDHQLFPVEAAAAASKDEAKKDERRDSIRSSKNS